MTRRSRYSRSWTRRSAARMPEPTDAASITNVQSNDRVTRQRVSTPGAQGFSPAPERPEGLRYGFETSFHRIAHTYGYRTVRDGADAVDVGEPRRVRLERKRRTAPDPARARGDG